MRLAWDQSHLPQAKTSSVTQHRWCVVRRSLVVPLCRTYWYEVYMRRGWCPDRRAKDTYFGTVASPFKGVERPSLASLDISGASVETWNPGKGTRHDIDDQARATRAESSAKRNLAAIFITRYLQLLLLCRVPINIYGRGAR